MSVRVRLTPKSSRDGLEGLCETAEGPALKARVRAVPENGAANAAVEALLAKALGVPRTSVGVVSGHSARVKRLAIEGDAADLEVRLKALLD